MNSLKHYFNNLEKSFYNHSNDDFIRFKNEYLRDQPQSYEQICEELYNSIFKRLEPVLNNPALYIPFDLTSDAEFKKKLALYIALSVLEKEDIEHLLVHFPFNISKEAKEEVLKVLTDKDEDAIMKAIEGDGSKFYPEFMAQSPQELLLKGNEAKTMEIRSIYYKYREENKDKGLLMGVLLTFDKTIGTDGVVCLDELSDNEKREVKQEPRRGRPNEEINFIVREEWGPPTKQLFIILVVPLEKYNEATQTNELAENRIPKILTICPGRWTPPMDDKEFWSNHAFIRKKRS